MTFLSRRGTLSTAVHSAIGEATWPHLVRRIAETAGKLADLRIELTTPFTGSSVPDESFLRMDKLITAGPAPMVYMRGKYRHYSVISGYTPASFKLFDSFGYRWVRRASCSVAEAHKLTLHRFHIESLIALSAIAGA